jgi:hypothetical protein
MICVSSRYCSGKSGRIARSMKRQTSTSRSERRASRLKKPPGILPAAEVFSTTSTVSGKKSMPGLGVPRSDEDHGFAIGHDHGAGGLLGHAASFECHDTAAHVEGDRLGFEPIRCHVRLLSDPPGPEFQ